MCRRRRRRKLEDTVDSDTLMLKQTKECKTMPNKYHPQIKHKASRRLLLVLLPNCEEEAAIEESGRRVAFGVTSSPKCETCVMFIFMAE